MFCMLVGHTYSEIDRSFNTMIQKLRAAPIWSVKELCQAVYSHLAPYNCKACQELHSLWDWKNFFKPFVHQRIGGFSTSQFGSGMHEFRVLRDSNGKARLSMRKSSVASTWLPDGEGYEIFKDTPTGQPDLANAHKDTSWSRTLVENNVRRWYKYFSVTQEERQRLENEWQARFDALPEDGDISTLPEDLKLVWVDLPRRVQQPMVNVAGSGHYFPGGASAKNPHHFHPFALCYSATSLEPAPCRCFGESACGPDDRTWTYSRYCSKRAG